MMQPYHEATDQTKVAELAASIEQDGWQGAPLVTFGEDQLITGSHRYAAARSLDWIDAEVPTIDISDVFAEDGKDFDATWAELMDMGLSIEAATIEAMRELSDDIKAEYGIDIEG